jgi:hypothetical protein
MLFNVGGRVRIVNNGLFGVSESVSLIRSNPLLQHITIGKDLHKKSIWESEA